MNSLKNLFALLSTALFAVILVMEVFVKKSGFTSPAFIVAILMLVLMLACRFVLVTKYKETNRDTMLAATETLKDISLPMGFIGSLTMLMSIIFTICTIVSLVTKFITLPDIVLIIVNAVSYVTIAILPLAFAMSLLGGKYSSGTDFMLYAVGLIVYIITRYFFDGAINPFVCSQLLLALSLWDMTSGLMRKEAPVPKAPKEKKPKKEKVSKQTTETKTEET